MGRPRKQTGDRKTDALAFRLTAAERLRIEHAASAAGLTAAAYARAQTLSGRVVVQKQTSLDHAAFDELRRIGVNLNQLTKLAHQGRPIPAEITATAAALEAFLAQALGHTDPLAAPAPLSPPAQEPPSASSQPPAAPPAPPPKPGGPHGP